ncbi:MAG TPA: hypothetical protein VNG90_05845 [Candidatus Acidoferrum sp.]|nr:hypothetical protein [Candidatus Acidoferrum sp.]
MKKVLQPDYQAGYIALLTVLVVGAASLAIGTTLLLTGSDAERESLVEQQSVDARSLASACGEDGLQQIHDSSAYTGTNNLTLGTGTCTYTVTNTGGQTRTVDASGTVGLVVRKIKIYVTIGSSSISITSWQDVV